MKDLIQTWQSSQEVIACRSGALPTSMKELPNATALVLNLQHVEVRSTLEKLGMSTPEEIKAHKALRATFVIVKMLFAGFTYIDTEGGDKDFKYRDQKGSAKPKGGPKDKLGAFDQGGSEHVILNCYKIESKKGIYKPSRRLEECVALSPGMVMNVMIWGDKIIPTFKHQKEDLLPFQFALVQLSLKSSSSEKAGDAGRMLDVKSFMSMTDVAPSSFKILKEGLLANSVQAAGIQREQILDGSLISEKTRENLNQKLIQGCFSNTVQVLALTPQSFHGVISLAADGKIKLFLTHPIGDVNAYAINLDFDRKAHHCPGDGSRDEWMARFLNVSMMMGSLQLLVVIDSYKNKDVPVSDIVLDAYARINLPGMHKAILEAAPSAQLLGLSTANHHKAILATFEQQGMPNAGKHLFLYPSCAPELDILIDMRKMTNKKDVYDMHPSAIALVHVEGAWKSGHMLHVFFQQKSVLCLVIPLIMEGSGDRTKRGLHDAEVRLADVIKDVEFEEEDEDPAENSAENSAKSAASTTTTTITEEEDPLSKPAAVTMEEDPSATASAKQPGAEEGKPAPKKKAKTTGSQ